LGNRYALTFSEMFSSCGRLSRGGGEVHRGGRPKNQQKKKGGNRVFRHDTRKLFVIKKKSHSPVNSPGKNETIRKGRTGGGAEGPPMRRRGWVSLANRPPRSFAAHVFGSFPWVFKKRKDVLGKGGGRSGGRGGNNIVSMTSAFVASWRTIRE